jgi:hypothetical protein
MLILYSELVAVFLTEKSKATWYVYRFIYDIGNGLGNA